MTTHKEALTRIAAYPFTRAEELSVEQMREIAREALMSVSDEAQQNPQGVSNEQVEPVAKKWLLHGSFADVASFDTEGFPSFYSKESFTKFKNGELSAPCKGKNCGSLNGWLHSAECRAEHESHYTHPPVPTAQPKEPEQEPDLGGVDVFYPKDKHYKTVISDVQRLFDDKRQSASDAVQKEIDAYKAANPHCNVVAIVGDLAPYRRRTLGLPDSAPLYTTPPTQQSCSQRPSRSDIKPLTDAMVSAAARVLNDRQAEACGVDKDDQWKVYGEDFIEDARAMLTAAHGIKGEA